MFYTMKKIIASMIAILLTITGNIDFAGVIFKPETVMAEYYVNNNGDDSNDGTKDRPFATIERARDEVRKINADMTGNIIVHIAEGTYILDDALTFDERDSASNGFAVKYVGNGEAVISGGQEIENFTLFDAEKNIYSAKVPEGLTFRQLYVDGVKMTRARSNTDFSTRIVGASRFKADGTMIPENLNYGGEDSLVPAAYGEIYLNASEFGDFNNLEQVELHVLTAWVKNVLRVKSAVTNDGITSIRIQDNESRLIFNRMHPNIDGYSHMSTHDFVYYIENAYELIDNDNEWYLDESTDTVYIKVPENTDINSSEVVVPRLEKLISTDTTDGSKIQNLSFEGLTFRYSNWTVPSTDGLVDIQAGMYANYCIFKTNDMGVLRPSAAIYIAGTENFTMKNCTVENMGAAGIDLHYGTKNSVIQDNLIQNISGNGIMIGKFVVDENTDIHVVYNPEDESDICTGDRIVNNRVMHIGTDYESSVGICAGYPRDILIANNEVAYAPYTGISVGFGWSIADNAMKNNRILNNEIHHTSQILCDAGGIYTLSKQPGSEMSGNYIHDIVLPEWADYGTSGIYMDENTEGYTVKYNVLENAYGVNMHRVGHNEYEDKTMYVDKKWNPIKQSIIKNAGINDYFDAYAKLFY
ncbi:MAG: right-handed parallel beta-helix repeat-containing protein [Clostridia bacterium]|nr:right-handed parallel beta-helix repeat-containing protein [Clostridia bacterium]